MKIKNNEISFLKSPTQVAACPIILLFIKPQVTSISAPLKPTFVDKNINQPINARSTPAKATRASLLTFIDRLLMRSGLSEVFFIAKLYQARTKKALWLLDKREETNNGCRGGGCWNYFR